MKLAFVSRITGASRCPDCTAEEKECGEGDAQKTSGRAVAAASALLIEDRPNARIESRGLRHRQRGIPLREARMKGAASLRKKVAAINSARSYLAMG